jgi:hypothetical protein
MDGKEEADHCLRKALRSGMYSAGLALAISGSFWFTVSRYSEVYRNKFSPTLKTALLAMPVFYSGYLYTELEMHECMHKASSSKAVRVYE